MRVLTKSKYEKIVTTDPHTYNTLKNEYQFNGNGKPPILHYTELLDQLIAVTTASTVVAYALYTLAPDTHEKFGTNNLIWTLPFVMYGVFRYLYLIYGANKGGNPTRTLLTDPPIIINGALWLICVIVIIMNV